MRKRRGRGEGSIYRRGEYYCAALSAGYNANGKRRRQVVYGKTKAEVQQKLDEVRRVGISGDESKITLGHFLDRWLQIEKKPPKVAQGTYNRYEEVIRLHIKPYIGHLRLAKVAPMHVEQLIASLADAKQSLSTQRKASGLLHTAFRKAVRLQLILYNPAADTARPKVQRQEMRVLSAGDVDAFLKQTAGDRLHCLYVTALATGMRSGELFGLEWRDINFDDRSVAVQRAVKEVAGKLSVNETKSRKGRRRIDLPGYCVDALAVHRRAMLAEGHATRPVFCDSGGGYLRRPNVKRRSFAPALTRAGLPQIRFHDLRHTHATILLTQGVHPKVVSERLGHASIEITLNTYSHVLPTMQRDAADKLDRLFG